MGLMQAYNIDCDYCHEWEELGVDRRKDIRWLRRYCKKMGWIRRRDDNLGRMVDVCPECVAKEKEADAEL